MQVLLYNLIIHSYHLGIRIAAFFHPKAKLWVKGRQQYFEQLEAAFSNNRDPVIWMHCSSLGEFEQGRPILEALRKDHPDYQLLLTFFSPSGYEIRKGYEGVDHVFYLPLDTSANAIHFLKQVQPKLAIFVKYEFWYHFLHQLHQQKIPTILISATFRKDQIFFKRHGAIYRKMLSFFQHIFVQTEASQNLLTKELNLHNTSVAGDTRIDRVVNIAAAPQNFSWMDSFANDCPIMVGGSTWPQDESILCPFINKHIGEWKFILAPHDVSKSHILAIQQRLTVPSQRISQLNIDRLKGSKVLIVDNIGMLSSIFASAKLAYIGGGFGKNIHNILEPAAYGIPIVYGPKHQTFIEAVVLKEMGGGFVVWNSTDFEQVFNTLSKESFYKTACQQTQSFIQQQQGATNLIMKYISSKINGEHLTGKQ